MRSNEPQSFEQRRVIFYLFGVGCFLIALILLPSYLGSLIAKNQWQMLSLFALGFTVLTLYFSELRYLIASATLVFLLTTVNSEFIAVPALKLRWVFLITLSLVGVVHWTLGRVPARLRIIDLWALAFLSFAFYSRSYSIDPSLTLERSFSITLFYLAIFWGVWVYVQDEEKVVIILRDFLVLSIPFFLMGLFFLQKDRSSGIFQNPNAVGAYTGILMPILLWSYFCDRRKLALYLMALVIPSLLLSQSRAGMVSAVLGSAYFLIFYEKRSRHMIVILTVFLLGLLFLYMELFGSSIIEQYFRWETLSSGSGRLEAWKEVMRLIEARPWFGYGFGTEDQLFLKFDIIFQEHSGAYAHNSYIGLISQVGIIGALIFYLPLFGFFLYRTFRLERMSAAPNLWLEAALLGSVLSGLVNVFFESWLYSAGSSFTFPFWMFLVLAYRLGRPSPAEV